MNEKIQWLKLYDDDPRKTRLADKYLVREYVKEKIGEEYLIPLLGVWDSFDEIDFGKLPDRFVLKTNHGSGSNLIVKDKSKMDKEKAKEFFDKWMNTDFAYQNGFELHYHGIPRKIIAEKFLESQDEDLTDFKFMCFDGHISFIWVDTGRFHEHKRNLYDRDYHLLPVKIAYKNDLNRYIEKPENFDIMIRLAEKLASGFPLVRVDFYNIRGKIFFSEMTFTSTSGYDVPDSHAWNLEQGQKIRLPPKTHVIKR